MRLLAAFLALLLMATLALACEGGEEESTARASPAPAMTVTPHATPSPAATITAAPRATPSPHVPATPEPTPASGLGDEYEGWLIYTNDVYGYEFKYPPGATVKEAAESEFTVPREQWEQGVTFHDVYERYTGKICIYVVYKLGLVMISAPVNEEAGYVACGRTGRAFQGPDRTETLFIEGKAYTAGGFEEQGPGETTQYHNEYLCVALDDGTRIGYGTRPSDTATFEDYLAMRDDLVRIIESYRKLP